MTVTVYLVRHGETDLNASDRCQGSLDVPMNAAGEEQVAALAHRLNAVHFDAAYTSPLIRASNSARIILGASNTPLTEVPAFSELSYGTWQGLTHAEWPDNALDRWRDDPWSVVFPEGESLNTVRERAVPAFESIIKMHAGDGKSNPTLLITAHGHLNRVLLVTLANRSSTDFWKIAQINCEAWKLVFDVSSSGQVQLVSSAIVGEIISRAAARRAIDSKTKPLGALGYLEDCAIRLCVLQQTLSPGVGTSRVCVFGADHGISDEGVSAYPRAVTAEMMKNFNAGGAAINVLGKANNVQVEVVDVGVDASLEVLANIRHERVRNGSRNFVIEPAMTPEELERALEVGAAAVRRAVADGVQALGLGEMGIGNTTSAAALLSALTGRDAQSTVGLGTGVSPEAFEVKRTVVTRALALHGQRSNGLTARECLRCMGGLELAAIAGAVLESLNHSVAVVADGFISTVSVLCAAYIAHEEFPYGAHAIGDRVFLAHQSSELGHSLAVESFGALCGLQQRPLLDLEMRLGEGSGAALAMPLLRASAAIMRDMATFASAGVSAGDRAEQHS